MAEGSVVAVQMGGILMHDKELAAGGVGVHGAGHADDAAGVLDGVVPAVVSKLALDVPAGAAHAGALGAAALDHKAGDDPMEDQTVIKALAHQLQKVLHGQRGRLGVQLKINGFAVFHSNANHKITHAPFLFSPLCRPCRSRPMPGRRTQGHARS